MSLTTQRNVTVCLDEEHQPLRPVISWLDQRRTDRYPA
jgi:sugar (pentulose or hexulose) kinase